jgi:hypothetical protein
MQLLLFLHLRRKRWHDNMLLSFFVVVFQWKRQWQLLTIAFFFIGVRFNLVVSRC